jgi:hypothetical protein
MPKLSSQGQSPTIGLVTAGDGHAMPTDTRAYSNASRIWSSPRYRPESIDFAAINTAALSALPELLRRWLPDGRQMGHEYVALNPTRADRHLGSFRICLRGGKRGRWADFATGDTGGDPISLAAYLHRCSPLQAARRIADTLGHTHGTSFATERQRSAPPAAPHQPPAPQSSQDQSLSTYGRELWTSCRYIDSESPAARYLSARGCALPHPDGDLRWHPALSHPSGYIGPALVALVTDVLDAQCWLSLHRTWIAADGSGNKADVNPSRMLLKGHRKSGGCIRLWPDDSVTLGLGIAEGIETALTLARGFAPVWATIDAGNLAAFPYMSPIESLTVAVDHDPAGIRAFEALARRWWDDAAVHHARHSSELPHDHPPVEIRKVLAPHAGDDLNDWARGIDLA